MVPTLRLPIMYHILKNKTPGALVSIDATMSVLKSRRQLTIFLMTYKTKLTRVHNEGIISSNKNQTAKKYYLRNYGGR